MAGDKEAIENLLNSLRQLIGSAAVAIHDNGKVQDDPEVEKDTRDFLSGESGILCKMTCELTRIVSEFESAACIDGPFD